MRYRIFGTSAALVGMALSTYGAVAAGAESQPDNRTDYAATVVAGGIDVYSISETGEHLLKGMPFVPTPAVNDYPGGPSIDAPSYLAVDPTQRRVFALYAPPDASWVLWSFKLTPKGLVQENSVTLAAGGGGGHGPRGINFGITAHYFYYTFVPDDEGIQAESWYLYRVNDGRLSAVGGIGFETVQTESAYQRINPSSVTLDDSGQFVYACFPAYTLVPSAPSVSVYSVGSEAVSLAFTSTEPNFVQVKCGS